MKIIPDLGIQIPQVYLPKKGTDLLMPRLGEPVEPAHAHELAPWWRAVDSREPRQEPAKAPAMTLSKAMPWPFD